MQDPEQQYTAFTPEEEQEPIQSASLSQRQKRALVFHVLYIMDAFDYTVSLQGIVENVGRGFGYIIYAEDQVFVHAQAVIDKRHELDAEIQPLLAKWRFERIGVATRLILRYGIWEMSYTQAERTVVINEAIELAKCFAELEAYKFVNGILDRWVHERM